MFKTNFRIVDNLAELRSMKCSFFDGDYIHITGFVEIRFGEQNEGCFYHENPLQEGEVGGEWVDYWLDKLLDVVNSVTITNYAAFRELETVNRWLEFKLNGNKVTINVAIDETQKNNKLFITEHFNGFNYVEPTNFSVELCQFKNEIVSAVNRFITELGNINPELLKSKMVLELLNKLKV